MKQKDIDRVNEKVDHLGAKLLKRVQLLEDAEIPVTEVLNDLTDVNTSSAFNEFVLVYKGSVTGWVASRPPMLYSINAQKGNVPLTSADNGIQSDLITFGENTRQLKNFVIAQYGALSTGSYDIALKKLNGTAIVSHTVADASSTSTISISGSAYTNFTLGGIYLEITNITGTLYGANISFDAVEV